MTSRSSIPLSLINDWFNVGKEVERHYIDTHSSLNPHLYRQRGVTNFGDDDSSSVCSDRSFANFEERGANYAAKYKSEEDTLCIKAYTKAEVGSTIEGLSSLHLDKAEDLSTIGDVTNALATDVLREQTAIVYQKYQCKSLSDKTLKIIAHREKIIDMVAHNQVVIIQGSTGSGKTTQVPQFILQESIKAGRHANIVVTQPRRIGAISIAKRVCHELGDLELGGLVGYRIGLDNMTTDDTRLTFVTTGVLLQSLVVSKHLNDFTHVILDEIHERDMDTDFLMLLVRKLMRTVSKNTKVILMSATINTDIFSNYFSVPVCGRLVSAPVIRIEGFFHDIYEFWLDQIEPLLPEPIQNENPEQPKVTDELMELVNRLVFKFDEIELSEQKREGSDFAPVRGSVLIFLPGLEEINAMCKAFDKSIDNKWKLIKLHSSITASEQAQVFERAEGGFRKVIIATNIAESSITVPDIKYVIDFCLTKNLVCDRETNYSWLRLEWASKANLMQRRGRAGRVSSGRVYRLITKAFFNGFLNEYSSPEMTRCPLDKVILHTKVLDIGEPKAILGLALDPPDLSDIQSTMLTLMQVGAIVPIRDKQGILSSWDGDLTFVGRVISRLPVSVHLGKLLILGYLFGCLENCIIIAAGLSKPSIFSTSTYDYLSAYAKKLYFANGSFSDCIAIVYAYKHWRDRRDNGYFYKIRSSNREEKMFCRRVGIEMGGIREVDKLVVELTQRLDRIGIFLPRHGKKETDKTRDTDILILKLAIAGAFFPNYFTQSELDEQTIIRSLNGKDPRCHVQLSNMPMHQGILYEEQLYKGVFGDQLHPDPQPEHDHSKVFVRLSSNYNFHAMEGVFDDDRAELQPFEGIAPGVYLAVKMRLLRTKIVIYLHPDEEAKTLMAEIETDQKMKAIGQKKLRTSRMISSGVTQIEQVPLPLLQESTIELTITNVNNCGKFWANYASASVEMERIKVLIGKVMNPEFDSRPSSSLSTVTGRSSVTGSTTLSSSLIPGRFCLAPFEENPGSTSYHRARVESLSDMFVEVFFVDYGNKSVVRGNTLRESSIDEYDKLMKIPMQAFECELNNLAPCAKMCPSGTWSEGAKAYFCDTIRGKTLFGRVYSVVYNVVHLELIYRDRLQGEYSLNEKLKQKGFAIHKEEGYLSKQNHEKRKQVYNHHFTEPESSSLLLASKVPKSSLNSFGRRKLTIHGPFSPLEMSFIGLTKGMRKRSAKVEQDSVNSVALDSDPQDRHARLLVAAVVNLSHTGNRLTARSTTLMPNFHGLLAMVALLFSPQVELRTDDERKRYSGALCGLGYEQTSHRPLYADHDMEIAFDTQITDEDIFKINHARMVINCVLGFKGDVEEFISEQIDDVQHKLRESLLKLFTKERESVELNLANQMYRWGEINPRYEVEPVAIGINTNLFQVLPPIHGIQLTGFDYVEHNRELHNKANYSKESMNELCRLCNVYTYSPMDLLKHLATRHHREREYEIDQIRKQ